MKTSAYHYNEAVREIEGTQHISAAEAIQIVNGTSEVSLHLHCEEADAANERVRFAGKYPYNSDVARELLDILGIPETETSLDRAETIVYGSTRYRTAKGTTSLYNVMEASGYVPIHDITPDMDGKQALLKGKVSEDWMTWRKDDERVRLVAKEGRAVGYMKKGARSRYVVVGVDADLFVKLV